MAKRAMGPELTQRQLNRATLARQLLLERQRQSAFDAIEWLVGLQAQAPLAPYVGLWSRLVDFQAAELARLTLDRDVVRVSLMRNTVHLVSVADCVGLRPWLEPAQRRSFASTGFARDTAGIELDELIERSRALVEITPRTRSQLGQALAERWPDVAPSSLAYTATQLLPMVQVTPRGVWGATGQATWTTYEAWLGPHAAQTEPVRPEDVVVRYLAAFGPATVMDCQRWCGVTRLGEVVERLRPQLLTFRDEHGRELFDLPGAPRPDPEIPAPTRFLPEYDNVLLAHADKARVIGPGIGLPLPAGNGARQGTVLVDGRYRATWTTQRSGDRATIHVEALDALSRNEIGDIESEGMGVLTFTSPAYDKHAVVVAR